MEQPPCEGSGKRQPSKEPESERTREQWFHFGPWVFDVYKAQAIIASAPREPKAVQVEPWARFYGLTERLEGSFPLFGPRGLDKDYALTTDLNEPALIATMRNAEGEEFLLLIDGTHRLYRAYTEGAEQLPAYVLTVDETLSIRTDGFMGSPARGKG